MPLKLTTSIDQTRLRIHVRLFIGIVCGVLIGLTTGEVAVRDIMDKGSYRTIAEREIAEGRVFGVVFLTCFISVVLLAMFCGRLRMTQRARTVIYGVLGGTLLAVVISLILSSLRNGAETGKQSYAELDFGRRVIVPTCALLGGFVGLGYSVRNEAFVDLTRPG